MLPENFICLSFVCHLFQPGQNDLHMSCAVVETGFHKLQGFGDVRHFWTMRPEQNVFHSIFNGCYFHHKRTKPRKRVLNVSCLFDFVFSWLFFSESSNILRPPASDLRLLRLVSLPRIRYFKNRGKGWKRPPDMLTRSEMLLAARRSVVAFSD